MIELLIFLALSPLVFAISCMAVGPMVKGTWKVIGSATKEVQEEEGILVSARAKLIIQSVFGIFYGLCFIGFLFMGFKLVRLFISWLV